MAQIWRHIQLSQSSVADVTADLREGGQVRLRLEFDADTNPNIRDPSLTSLERPLQASPSRFSIRGRRPGTIDES